MYEDKGTVGLFERISLAMIYIGTASLMVLMAVNLIDISMRYLFNKGITGAIELESLLLTIISFFSLAATQYYKRHITITNLVVLCKVRVRLIIDVLVCLSCVVFAGMMAWQTLIQATRSFHANAITPIMSVYIAPFQFAGALGLLFLFLAFALDLLKALVSLSQPSFETN